MPSRAFLFFPPRLDGPPKIDQDWSQCPHGHFCFFHLDDLWLGWHSVDAVSVPSRAFLFFPHKYVRSSVGRCLGLSALTGIFVFSTYPWGLCRLLADGSQCPHGHFCFFHRLLADGSFAGWAIPPSQCPHGHFCFFHLPPPLAPLLWHQGLSALTGIFVFSTNRGPRCLSALSGKSQCPHGHFCFFHPSVARQSSTSGPSLSALTGIFVFSTSERRSFGIRTRGLVSVPSRAFLFFPLPKTGSITRHALDRTRFAFHPSLFRAFSNLRRAGGLFKMLTDTT